MQTTKTPENNLEYEYCENCRRSCFVPLRESVSSRQEGERQAHAGVTKRGELSWCSDSWMCADCTQEAAAIAETMIETGCTFQELGLKPMGAVLAARKEAA